MLTRLADNDATGKMRLARLYWRDATGDATGNGTGHGTSNGTARRQTHARAAWRLRGRLCEASEAWRAVRDGDMDVVLDDGKTCANVTHGAQRGRAGEGMDKVIVGIAGICEQGVLFGEAGGRVRSRWGQSLTIISELRRAISGERRSRMSCDGRIVCAGPVR